MFVMLLLTMRRVPSLPSESKTGQALRLSGSSPAIMNSVCLILNQFDLSMKQKRNATVHRVRSISYLLPPFFNSGSNSVYSVLSLSPPCVWTIDSSCSEKSGVVLDDPQVSGIS